MKRTVVAMADAVFNFASPLGGPGLLSLPCDLIARVAAALADWLDPIPPRLP